MRGKACVASRSPTPLRHSSHPVRRVLVLSVNALSVLPTLGSTPPRSDIRWRAAQHQDASLPPYHSPSRVNNRDSKPSARPPAHVIRRHDTTPAIDTVRTGRRSSPRRAEAQMQSYRRRVVSACLELAGWRLSRIVRASVS